MLDNTVFKGLIGIYKIEHCPTGKVYIGSSIDIGKRFKQHVNTLNTKNHRSRYLQRAWDKYGESEFKFSVIELVDNQQNLVSVEQEWLDIYESYDPEKGYNLCPTANSSLGLKWSEESKSKLSMWVKTEEHRSRISHSKKGKKLPLFTGDHKKKIGESNARDYIAVSPSGEQFKIRNLSQFCRDNNLCASSMVLVAQGKQKQHKGWYCVYSFVL